MGGGKSVEKNVSVSPETDQEEGTSDITGNPGTVASSKRKAFVAVGRAPANKTGKKKAAEILGDNEQPPAEPESIESPAPAVVKGGENEFVKVSHLASIEVNEVAQKQPTQRMVQRMKASPTNTTEVASELNDMEDDAEEKFHSQGRTRNFQASSPKMVDYLDDVSDSAPMDVIGKSPYEQGLNAEKGEKIFEEIKRLLEEDSSSGDVNPEALRVFGPTNGCCLVKANVLIDKSGMVFSQEWVRGNIRGYYVGKIPNHLLLLCLVPKRFIKASEHLLSGLCRDMEVFIIVNNALKDWGMEDDYKSISATTKNFNFTSQRRDCFKCAVFVARVYGCALALGIKKLNSQLMAKVKVCLEIMEDHLGDEASKKRKKLDVSSGPSNAPIPQSAQTPDLIQRTDRKRGRTPRQQDPLPVEPTKEATAAEDAKKKITVGKKAGSMEVATASPRNWRPNETSGATVKSATAAAPTVKPTFQQLMTQFEERYEEMGEKYNAMGKLLAQMRTAVEERREKTEQQIRDEVLEEVQKCIFRSIPKK